MPWFCLCCFFLRGWFVDTASTEKWTRFVANVWCWGRSSNRHVMTSGCIEEIPVEEDSLVSKDCGGSFDSVVCVSVCVCVVLRQPVQKRRNCLERRLKRCQNDVRMQGLPPNHAQHPKAQRGHPSSKRHLEDHRK